MKQTPNTERIDFEAIKGTKDKIYKKIKDRRGLSEYMRGLLDKDLKK